MSKSKFIRVKNKNTDQVFTISRERFERMKRFDKNNFNHLEETSEPITYAKKRKGKQVGHTAKSGK